MSELNPREELDARIPVAEGEGTASRIRPASLAHIAFRTRQLQEMQRWYCDVLCAEAVFSNSEVAFIAYDEEHHRIALVNLETNRGPSSSPGMGFYHAAFSYSCVQELVGTYERLACRGIRPWRLINHGPTISFYYRDPDGNDIELQVDRFHSAKEATQWMTGAVFAANPIGVEIDPEFLIRCVRAGIPDCLLFQRPDERGESYTAWRARLESLIESDD